MVKKPQQHEEQDTSTLDEPQSQPEEKEDDDEKLSTDPGQSTKIDLTTSKYRDFGHCTINDTQRRKQVGRWKSLSSWTVHCAECVAARIVCDVDTVVGDVFSCGHVSYRQLSHWFRSHTNRPAFLL